ncbi:MAG TPA: FAD-dependent oxidoreductase [Spirochaetota bacterium]|nr:FAD-dependent oxidoreductase [Spirochaetota bacterium]
MKHYDLLVIGGVAAGMSAASQARRVDKNMSIGVFEKSEYVSYAACGMPYFIGEHIDDYTKLIAIDKDDFIKKRGIDIVTLAEVEHVDFSLKKVIINIGGSTSEYGYDKLVIATGARPFYPSFAGIDLPGVFMLRNLNDGLRIREFIQKNFPRSGVIIGGGFIGLEMAETLRELGISCTIVERMDSVAMTMDPEIREKITLKLKEFDVDIRTGAEVEKITAVENRLTVALKGGGGIETDFIIASVGVVPNTAFVKDTGLGMTDRGAIVINEKSETNIPGVYAAGDCATVKHLITGKDTYMPMGTTANKQGRVAGLQTAGVSDEVFRGIVGTQLVKVFDLEVAKTGFNEHDAEQAGIPVESASATWHDIAGYCPAAENIFVKLFINKDTRELIGGQTLGRQNAAQRINVVAAAITSRMKLGDFAYLDLGYAPPFAPVWDALLVAAQKLIRR